MRGRRRCRLGIPGAVFAIVGACFLSACGAGGVQVAGGGTGGTGISTGVMTKGSVIVNGVRFEESLAQITIDDADGLPDDLQDGMVVKVRGTFNDDGLNGEAERIEAENEVQGAISAIGPETDAFTVLGVKVFVDGGTVFSNVPGSSIAGLSEGDVVEVHGLRDPANDLRATRVELLSGPRLLEPDELKGTVSGHNPADNTFFLGTQPVSYTGATIRPPGTIVDGIPVEVNGSLIGATLVASIVDLEDLEDAAFDPAEGEEVEVEGFVSGFSVHPGTFFVDGRPVETTSSTRFEGGISLDLADGVRVEAEGRMSGSSLIAEKIEFEESIRMETNVQVVGTDSITVLGKTVFLTSRTEKDKFVDPVELAGQGVKVRGFANLDGATITATRIEKLDNPVGLDQHELQGPVGSFDAAARTLVILEITVDASGPGVQFDADDDNPVSPSQFFAALTENRTVVDVRGTFDAPTATIQADRVEIE